ncbi:MAG: ABC transporter permease [Albidovulum sp.]|nr:ABC transporter permease [Albidovulum sp.]
MQIIPSRDPQRSFVIATVSILTGLILWSLLSGNLVSATLLPHPRSVWLEAVEQSRTGVLWESIGISLWRIGCGWALGAAAGVFTGLVLGGVRAVEAIIGPIFEFLKGIAPISLVPIMILWFGIGELPKVLIIAYITWVVVAVSTMTGVKEVPKTRLRAGRCLGLSQAQMFYKIILPSATPFVLSGIRSGLGFAYIALVSAEIIAVDKGIGFLIMDSRLNLQTPLMLVGIFALGLLGASSQLIFDLVTRRILWFSRFRNQ